MNWIYFHHNYPEVRNIKTLHAESACFSKFGATRIGNALGRRIWRKSQFWEHFYCRISCRTQTYAHVFNGFVISNLPWVTTFESSLPRLPKGHSHAAWRFSIMLFLSRRCLALICISERAKLLQYESLDRWVIEGRLPQKNADRIKAKTFVLPPPQHRLAPQEHAPKMILYG